MPKPKTSAKRYGSFSVIFLPLLGGACLQVRVKNRVIILVEVELSSSIHSSSLACNITSIING